ncbi:YbjN domain-containing protein [Litorihabitans aurantiacus]|uniref:YbjN domain-containing protein n=1 Tax=Litorihabitans aurantiacus TaxID=1930061 RepID=A0AA37UWQ9_9MICO|nr:YbjN domain-containing protein [Litorihabitans aurantiacus]GMA30667.1 hypothetical protein GCM10025875_06590 [Litorihabitans aurantiacus]
MGFFTKPQDAASAGGLAPLTTDRIKATLDARGSQYGVDDDGDVGGYWDGHLFYFFLLGQSSEYLQVRGRWNRRVGIDQLDAVTRLVNTWNADKLWPKVYVRAEDDLVGVYAEHTVDYEHGVSDEQLDLHLACAIATSGQAFDQLDESYPSEAAAARAEFERE